MINRIAWILFLLTAALSLQAQKVIDDVRINTRGGEEPVANCEGLSVLIPMTTIYDSIEIYIDDDIWLENSISRKGLLEASADAYLIIPMDIKGMQGRALNFKLHLIRQDYIFEKRVKFPEGYCYMTLDVNIDRRTKKDIQKIKAYNARADSCRNYPELWEEDDICPEPIPLPPAGWNDYLNLYFRNSLPGPCSRRMNKD